MAAPAAAAAAAPAAGTAAKPTSPPAATAASPSPSTPTSVPATNPTTSSTSSSAGGGGECPYSGMSLGRTRFVEAQNLWDASMAHAIAAALQALPPGGLVVHVCGEWQRCCGVRAVGVGVSAVGVGVGVGMGWAACAVWWVP